MYSGEATAANLFLSVEEEDVQFEAVVRPRAQLQLARLNVERKVDDVDRTRRLEDGRWHPEHVAVRRDDGHRVAVLLQSLVGTTDNWQVSCCNVM